MRDGTAREQVTLPRPESTVRIGGIMALPAVLRSLGADPAELLAEAGFAPTLFDDPGNLVPYAARNRLLAHCAARTGCRHLGLLVGQHGGLHHLGLLGLLVKSSSDVESALRSLVRHAHLHVQGAIPTLAVDEGAVMLGFENYHPHAAATEQVADGALATLCNIMHALCGAAWKPIEVRLAHDRPAEIRPYRRFFRAPLRFNAEQNSLVFSAHWLQHRLPEIDPDLRRVLQKEIDALDPRHEGDFPAQVRAVLRTALLTGHARSSHIAALFSMHTRTLNRRLTAFGTGFQQLVDESRFEIARQMLESSAMDVSEIATMLDYADASAFTRAFRRWSGTTPARWRATRRRVNQGTSATGDRPVRGST